MTTARDLTKAQIKALRYFAAKPGERWLSVFGEGPSPRTRLLVESMGLTVWDSAVCSDVATAAGLAILAEIDGRRARSASPVDS